MSTQHTFCNNGLVFTEETGCKAVFTPSTVLSQKTQWKSWWPWSFAVNSPFCFLQLILAIQGVDRIIGQLMNGLKQIGLHRCLNIIILADHGNTQDNHIIVSFIIIIMNHFYLKLMNHNEVMDLLNLTMFCYGKVCRCQPWCDQHYYEILCFVSVVQLGHSYNVVPLFQAAIYFNSLRINLKHALQESITENTWLPLVISC